MYKCRACNREVSESVRICPHCGDIDAIYNETINTLQLDFNKNEKKREKSIIIVSLLVWIITGFGASKSIWLVIFWLISPIVYYIIGLWLFGESSKMISIKREKEMFIKWKENLKM